MIDVDADLVLPEGRGNYRDHLATVSHLVLDSTAVDPVGPGRDQIRPVREFGLEQRSRNGINHREIYGAVPLWVPDGRRETVDPIVRAVVGEGFRHPHRVARLVNERGLCARELI